MRAREEGSVPIIDRIEANKIMIQTDRDSSSGGKTTRAECVSHQKYGD